MRLLYFVLLLGLPLILQAQNRNYDGSDNNLRHPEWGGTHTVLSRIAPSAYQDGISEPMQGDLPNPREISNHVMAQPVMYFDTISHLSDFLWSFGQFIDHDIILTEGGGEIFCSDVPMGDQFFDPFNTGTQKMCITRSVWEEGTGTSADNPREHVNGITAWVDGSAVYGSSKQRADWLRTFEGGKLKTSENGLLPWNTVDGEYNSAVDPNAPLMVDDTGRNDKLYVAGDLRANENVLLTAIHNVFVLEHNRICDELSEEHPGWTDEEIFQYARKFVGGLIQNITFNEWLPATGVFLENYRGYNPNLDPSISNEFSAFAFRLGHTLVNAKVMRLEMDNTVSSGGHLNLRNAFFNPLQLRGDGLCPIIKGATCQEMQIFDRMLIDDLRNFLFGPPGSGGMDLATINIMRARERGIPDLNTIRASMGLPTYVSFDEVNSDYLTSEMLSEMYEDLNSLDPWVGILAEQHMSDCIFGETTVEIIKDQFTALRDGDRFYFQIDPVLSLADKRTILNTTLSDVVIRNTCMGSVDMPEDGAFSKAFDCSTLSSDEHFYVPNEISIYPNPVIDQFKLEFYSDHAGEGILTISDQLGREISNVRKSINQGDNQIVGAMNESLPKGSYYVKIQTNHGTFLGNLVKL